MINIATQIKELTDMGLSLEKATSMVEDQLKRLDAGKQSNTKAVSKTKVISQATTIKLDTMEDLEAWRKELGLEPMTAIFKMFTPEKGANAFKTGIGSNDGFPSKFSAYLTGVDGTTSINLLLDASPRIKKQREVLENALLLAKETEELVDKLSMTLFKDPNLQLKNYIAKK